MKIASTAAFTAGMNAPIVYRGPFYKIFSDMVEDGYKAVKVHIADSREIDRKELWRDLNDSNLILTSIGTGAAYGKWHWNIGDHSIDTRRKALECLREHMYTAQPDHAIIIIGSLQGRFRDANSPEEFEYNIEESLYQIDRMAMEMDVPVGFEIMNHYESDFLYNISQGSAYIKAHDYKKIRLHIDTVHMNIEEKDLGGVIRKAGGLINHVHIADNDRYYPGHARINFREILQALMDIQYHGALALETYCFPESRYVGRRSLAYLNFILEELNEENN